LNVISASTIEGALMKRSNAGILCATGLLALALAGCGGGGSTSSSSASSASGSANEHSTTTAKVPAASTTTAASGASSTSGGVATVSVEHSSLGSILVAGPKKLTVYLFLADKGPMSTCSSACAEVWPPVTTTGAPKAAGGAETADLGTITRSDGTKQVTYKGHPLYYYVGDGTSGETSGQGLNSFGAPWYVLSPSGSEVQ
jgi:predicted lipoprotein with Yx(FWY)xxD motif